MEKKNLQEERIVQDLMEELISKAEDLWKYSEANSPLTRDIDQLLSLVGKMNVALMNSGIVEKPQRPSWIPEEGAKS